MAPAAGAGSPPRLPADGALPPSRGRTIGAVLRDAAALAAARGRPAARLDAERLTAQALGLSRAMVLAERRAEIPPAAAPALDAALGRWLGGEPAAYVLGRAPFLDLDLAVSPAVLIPRPETEALAEWAIARVALRAPAGAPGAGGVRVLDVGTGSGALAVAVARAAPAAAVWAVDVSRAALAVARRNAAEHGVAARVTCLAADLLPPAPPAPETFDLVVANLPYVGTDETAEVAPEVLAWEPRHALFAGPDGLALIRRLLERLPAHLDPGADVGLEVGWRQADAVAALMRRALPDHEVATRRDEAGIERLVLAMARPAAAAQRPATQRDHPSPAAPTAPRPTRGRCAQGRRDTRPVVGIDASRGFGPAVRETGTERYAREVVGRLARGGEASWRLYAQPGASGLPEGPAVERVTIARRRLWTHLGLGPEIARRPPAALFVPAHVMPLPCRAPALVTVHDVGFRLHPAAHPWAHRAYLEWSTRRHVRRAARLVADSEATAGDLRRLFGADPARLVVAPLGVEAAMAPPSAAAVAALRARLGLPEGARYALHVGTLQPRKNLARLVAAFAALAATRPDAWLVLAGAPGWGGDEVGRAAAAHGVAGRVLRPGYLPRADLPALYGGAVVAVTPSLHEGFGLPALEAMACGTAVALATGSSLPEVGGDAAAYFDPLDVAALASALASLWDDEAHRAHRAAAARARAAAFTWERTAVIVRAALLEVARSAPGDGRGR